jgi:hypothetical protein
MVVLRFPDRHLDHIFRALDERRLRVGTSWWRLRVYSVRVVDDCLWMQLDAVGEPTVAITLRQPAGADVESIVSAIASRISATDDGATLKGVSAVVLYPSVAAAESVEADPMERPPREGA